MTDPKSIKLNYTIKELSNIFQLSPKSTIRHLKHFNIPIITKERFKSHIPTNIIQSNNPELYLSIELTLTGKVQKPFYTIRDLCPMFYKTHSGMYRWLKRHNLPVRLCGNKTILLASVLLTLQSAPN